MTLMMEAARGLGEAPGSAISKIALGGGICRPGSRHWVASACSSASPAHSSLALSTLDRSSTRARDGVSHRRRRQRPHRSPAGRGGPRRGGGGRPRCAANARSPTRRAAAGGVALVPAGAREAQQQRGSDSSRASSRWPRPTPPLRVRAARRVHRRRQPTLRRTVRRLPPPAAAAAGAACSAAHAICGGLEDGNHPPLERRLVHVGRRQRGVHASTREDARPPLVARYVNGRVAGSGAPGRHSCTLTSSRTHRPSRSWARHT